MVKVALAGASSGIGLAILNELRSQSSHSYIILTRAPKDDRAAVVVDYTSVPDLIQVLEAHSVHTVISSISIADEASGQSQLNLIEASKRSKSVQRFLPSEFGADYKQRLVHFISIMHVPSYAFKFKSREALARSDLEYSIVSIGMFLDYWASSHVPSVLDPRKGTAVFIDLAHNYAALPGNGDVHMVFTHSLDAARYVIAMLDLPKWSRTTFFAGDRITLKEFVRQAEITKGVPFEVEFDDINRVREGKVTLPPNVKSWLPGPEWAGMFAQIAQTYLDGGFDLDYSRRQNGLFPHIKAMSVQDILNLWKP